MVMEMNLDYDPAAILTGTPPTHHIISIPNLPIASASSSSSSVSVSAWFQKYSRILHFMHVGALIMMYPSLIALVQVKFQSEKQSPFETHGSFMIMSVVALITAICTLGILFYIGDHSQSSMGKHFSLIHYMILKAVFCFSGILAPLLLVLTLFIPQNLNWIGYLIVCTLFVLVVGCNVCSYTKMLGNKD